MKKVRILYLCLAVLVTALVICMGLLFRGAGKEEEPSGSDGTAAEHTAADGLDILEFYIGESVGITEERIQGEDTEYVICIILPVDTDFKNCVANITLPEGAYVSEESPCWRTELGGRPVLDLTLEERDLIIVNGGGSRAYRFEIELER